MCYVFGGYQAYKIEKIDLTKRDKWSVINVRADVKPSPFKSINFCRIPKNVHNLCLNKSTCINLDKDSILFLGASLIEKHPVLPL